MLKEKFGDKIYSAILYGSFARQEKDFDDIDIIIITKGNLGGIYQVTNMFTKEVFCKLLRKYGMLFSILVYDQKNFYQLKGFPLYEEIKKDGVLLYGKKVLVKKTIKSLS
jgi:predicted nucleotidyltransferase